MTTTLPAPPVTDVESALRAAVELLDPDCRRLASYQLGWCDADGHPAPDGRGKGLRPRLALLSAQAVGAPAETGLPGAVAVELVHNFSLVHDDVMDGDTTRRHRPTVWAAFGTPAAILTGDGMLNLAQQVLLGDPAPERIAAARLLADAVRELVRGQFEDVAFEHRQRVGLDECLAMAAAKTGALLGAAASIGAVLAGAAEPAVSALHAYGRHLGLAFQVVDDLLGIWGDPAVTGKPVLSDLRTRKKSIPITKALSSGTAEGSRLGEWFTDVHPHSEPSLHRAAALVEASGARAWSVRLAEQETELAVAALDRAPLCPGPRAALDRIARELVGRAA